MTTNEHRRPLAPGEIRTHTVGSRTFQVMHVAGGSFTQASVRGPGQPSRVLATSQWGYRAIDAYADAIEQAESDAVDALDDADGPSFTASGAFISDAPQDMSAHGVPEVEQQPADPYAERESSTPFNINVLRGLLAGTPMPDDVREAGLSALRRITANLLGETPREPRTWPKLTDQSDDDLPDAVTVDDIDHPGVWRRCSPDGVLYTDGMSATTLAELRTFGDVTEVLG